MALGSDSPIVTTLALTFWQPTLKYTLVPLHLQLLQPGGVSEVGWWGWGIGKERVRRGGVGTVGPDACCGGGIEEDERERGAQDGGAEMHYCSCLR